MDALNNIAPFYIGEIVEYITGLNMLKGTKVRVTDLWQKPCGCWSLNFNNNPTIEKLHSPGYSLWKCDICHKCFGGKIFKGWSAKSFKSIQQTSFPLMTFEKIKEKEEKEVLILN